MGDERPTFILCLDWSHNGRPQDALWKAVRMQCLPPVGAVIWLEDGGGHLDSMTVERIEWWESSPGFYEVHLSELAIVDDEQPASTVEWLRSLGWRTGEWFDDPTMQGAHPGGGPPTKEPT